MTQSAVGWIHRCVNYGSRGLTAKLYLNFQLWGGLVPLTPLLFKVYCILPYIKKKKKKIESSIPWFKEEIVCLFVWTAQETTFSMLSYLLLYFKWLWSFPSHIVISPFFVKFVFCYKNNKIIYILKCNITQALGAIFFM